jgi:hypothetical protein
VIGDRDVTRSRLIVGLFVLLAWACGGGPPAGTPTEAPAPAGVPQSSVPADPLPSWNDGPSKRAIVDFVGRVTREGAPDFVPGPDRIATFDNDGTLWGEQPLYVQLAFALDRVKTLAPQHPGWKDKQPF